LASFQRALNELGPQVVFNLVESLANTDRLMPAVPLVLSSLSLPFTGSDAEGMLLSGDKLLAKRTLRAAGLPTADCWSLADLERLQATRALAQTPVAERVILKPVFEHASFGLDDACVVSSPTVSALVAELQARAANSGRPWFAERFVEGREFNLSILEIDGEPHVLPVAEIDFSDLPADKPRIVGYAAKWEASSAEYQLTPRRFDFSPADRPLCDALTILAERCWRCFRMHGYARVDFRVDLDGRPMILEINANPCLSPDAGFAAAVAEANLDFDRAISFILTAATNAFRGVPACS
jgi:D-alanine-D-alanine ligase